MKPMFEQRHYEFLARFFSYELSVSDTDRANTIKGIVRLLASVLDNENPKFDRRRFLAAANVPE